MARLEYFIVCRAISVDIDTEEITLSQVIEDVFPEEFPNQLPRIVAVSSWEMTPEELGMEFQAILRVFIPGSLEGADFPMNLARGRRRYRAIQGVTQIPLLGPGDLKFEVLLNGQHGATHVVTVQPPGTRATDTASSSVLSDQPPIPVSPP
jgi:hypothetical protein